MSLEALWYEASPYVYLAVGAAAILFSNSALGFVFSAGLVAFAALLLGLRAVYRSPARERLRKYARPGKAQRLPFGRA